MDEIDEALKAWGANWRAQQEAVPDGFARDSRMAAPPAGRFVWPALFTMLAIIGVAWVAPRAFTPSSSSRLAPLDSGDEVVGTGSIVDSAGKVSLCIVSGGRLLSPVPTCSVVRVPLSGLDARDVPGVATVGDVRYATGVSIRGTWDGETVVVTEFDTGAADNGAAEVVINPCANAEGPGDGLGTPDEEAAAAKLGAEVFGHPDVYGGLWRAASSDGLGRIVVGVKGDTASKDARLRALYGFPLCVVPVLFSEADLNSALRETVVDRAPWYAEVDLSRNRVVVAIGVVTSELLAAIKGGEERIVVHPLVSKVE